MASPVPEAVAAGPGALFFPPADSDGLRALFNETGPGRLYWEEKETWEINLPKDGPIPATVDLYGVQAADGRVT